MAYLPFVWKDDPTGGTPITAVRLNAIEAALSATSLIADNAAAKSADSAIAKLIETGTALRTNLDARYDSKQVPSTRNLVTGWFHVDDFGAKGDGVARDEAAVQAAIDAANAAYIATGIVQRVFFGSKTYVLGPRGLATDAQVIYGALLRSGVEMYGNGRLLCAPQSYWIGTQYSLIRSDPAGIERASIVGLTIDGNRSAFNVPGDTTQCNNITLGPSRDVTILNITSNHAAGTGIMVAGHSDNKSTDVRIEGCRVYDTGNIGIQCAQFNGLVIHNNIVRNTSSNGIDIYGEHDNHTGAITGENFRITNNQVHDCTVGVFLETVARGLVSGNYIHSNSEEGIHVNRINGTPSNINIVSNSISYCVTGIGGTGDAVNVTIRANDIENYNRAGIYFGGGGSPGDSGTIAGYVVMDNTMNGNSTGTPMIVMGSGLGRIYKMFIRNNFTYDGSTPYVVNYGPKPFGCTWDTALYPGQ